MYCKYMKACSTAVNHHWPLGNLNKAKLDVVTWQEVLRQTRSQPLTNLQHELFFSKLLQNERRFSQHVPHQTRAAWLRSWPQFLSYDCLKWLKSYSVNLVLGCVQASQVAPRQCRLCFAPPSAQKIAKIWKYVISAADCSVFILDRWK